MNKYRGMHMIYSQGRGTERNAKGRKKASIFLDHAVRYQDPTQWDDIASMDADVG
eukprot:CAMPEP_0197257356 /NCGR_PEP_ID=MMETSP1429-20130617/78422_1 /TAXON_ID=49237 /ORGANISM="Chaetoceros  sp., Strain UNC1202" /LENGTH=54 /DNA_ID=CAMNT_0042721171 /DNA_START=42 /DNA_END=202 /DNA_ORIENTATION=+